MEDLGSSPNGNKTFTCQRKGLFVIRVSLTRVNYSEYKVLR